MTEYDRYRKEKFLSDRKIALQQELDEGLSELRGDLECEIAEKYEQIECLQLEIAGLESVDLDLSVDGRSANLEVAVAMLEATDELFYIDIDDIRQLADLQNDLANAEDEENFQREVELHKK